MEPYVRRIESWFLFPFKRERGVRAYTEAARMLGILKQSRAMHVAGAVAADAASVASGPRGHR